MRAPLYSANPNELFEPAAIANPQPLHARLRSETPLARIGQSGVHLVATWDLIEEALSRESDFSANLTGVLMRNEAGDPTIFPMPEVEGGGIIATADEPAHSVHRSILQARFSPHSVAALEERVRRWSREAIREWLAGGAGEFVSVAELVPARVVGDLLGLPQNDVVRFRTWAMIGGDILAGNVDASRMSAVAGEALRMFEYLGEHLDRAGADLRGDAAAPLLHLLAGAVEDGRISRGVATGIAATLFAAGGESTAALIGSAVRWLAERPEIARALRARPESIPRFVEEVARLDPPFHFHYRAVKRSCELAGFELGPGDRLMLLWASANRDPAHFDDPDELRLDRKHGKDHLTFGRGKHFCIGATVARLEARIVCEELLRATKMIVRRPGHEPVYANSIMVRRLERIILDADPADERN
jgi:cytochrome P450 family 144